MTSERILAFDFGMKRIGVAVGQTLTRSATPLRTLDAKKGVPHWQAIDTLLTRWHPQALVVGIPTTMDGKDLYVTEPARVFAASLKERYALPVYHADERLTTVEARRQLFEAGGYRQIKKAAVDSLAAQLILEGWLAKNATR